MNPLFPELPSPQELRLKTDEEIQELLAAHQEVARKIAGKDEEIYGKYSQTEILGHYGAGVDQMKALREELATRGASDAEFEEKMSKLTEDAGLAEPSDEEKATEEVEEAQEALEVNAEETAEPETPAAEEATEEPVEEVAVQAEPVVAAAPPPVSPMDVRKAPLPVPAGNVPISIKESPVSLIASAGIPDIKSGERLTLEQAALAMLKLREAQVSFPPGFQDKAIVAAANWFDHYPKDRQLHEGDLTGNWSKIRAATGPNAMGVNPETGEAAIVASGGLCAPVTPYYGLWNQATAARPVRDALTSFAATRGGINVAAVPTIADISDAVGIKTAAQDAAGGTTALKTCQVVECPDFEETLLSMIYHCVQFGNLNSRAWPEFVAQFNDLVMAAHARLAETNLLNGIADASVAADGSAIYGASSTVLNQVLYITAAMRSYYRLSSATRFRALFPAWTREIVAADVVNSQFERFGVAPGDVDGLLRRYGVEPTWYLDSASGAGQIFGNQTDGALRDFPSPMVYYVFPEGSFLFLDGGTLELGIVRDSTLNSTNDYQIFGETFEEVAFIGPKSYEVTTEICNDGTVGAPATAITCSSS
jgi:hypothetical protein